MLLGSSPGQSCNVTPRQIPVLQGVTLENWGGHGDDVKKPYTHVPMKRLYVVEALMHCIHVLRKYRTQMSRLALSTIHAPCIV